MTELADKLVGVEAHTIDDERVEARIDGKPYAEDGKIIVPIRILTTYDEDVLEFVEPTNWTDDYRFVAFINDMGFDAANIDTIVGETIPVTYDGEWQPAFETNEPTVSPKYRVLLQTSIISFLAGFILPHLPAAFAALRTSVQTMPADPMIVEVFNIVPILVITMLIVSTIATFARAVS